MYDADLSIADRFPNRLLLPAQVAGRCFGDSDQWAIAAGLPVARTRRAPAVSLTEPPVVQK